MGVLTRSLNHILYAEKNNRLYRRSRVFFFCSYPRRSASGAGASIARGCPPPSGGALPAHNRAEARTHLPFLCEKKSIKKHVRKEKPLSRKQTETLTIRLTTEEKMELQKKMYEAVSPSMRDFILKMCRDGKIIVNEELRELNRELKYQGNNLNQLTRLAHQNRFSSADLSQLLSVYRKILAALGGQNHGGC